MRHMRRQGSEKLSDLPQVTQHVSDRAGIQIQLSPLFSTVYFVSCLVEVATGLILGRGDNGSPGSELDLRSLSPLPYRYWIS